MIPKVTKDINPRNNLPKENTVKNVLWGFQFLVTRLCEDEMILEISSLAFTCSK